MLFAPPPGAAAAGAAAPRARACCARCCRARRRWSRRICCPTAATASALRANGAGWSRWGTIGITRWRDDALRDAHGSFFYLRWDRAAARRCRSRSTRRPTRPRTTRAPSTPTACASTPPGPSSQAHTTVWVSPEDDIEFRQVELRNLSDRALDLELISAFEIDAGRPARRRGAPGLLATCSCAPTGAPSSRRCCSSARRAWPPSRACRRRTSWPRATRPGAARCGCRPTASAGSAATASTSQPLASFDAAPRRYAEPTHRARARHRARPGVRAGGAPAHRAARQGAADLRHRRLRRRAARCAR